MVSDNMKMIVMKDYELKNGEMWLVSDETARNMLFIIGIVLLGSFIGSLVMLWIWAVPIWASFEWVALCSLYLFGCTVFMRYLVRVVID